MDRRLQHNRKFFIQETDRKITMKFVLVLASVCCASAFGLHAATSSVKSLGYGVTSNVKPSVQPVDVFGVTKAGARGSLVCYRLDQGNL